MPVTFIKILCVKTVTKCLAAQVFTPLLECDLGRSRELGRDFKLQSSPLFFTCLFLLFLSFSSLPPLHLGSVPNASLTSVRASTVLGHVPKPDTAYKRPLTSPIPTAVRSERCLANQLILSHFSLASLPSTVVRRHRFRNTQCSFVAPFKNPWRLGHALYIYIFFFQDALTTSRSRP